MRIRFLDFLSAAAAGLQGIADPDVLELAAAEGRILVSQDTSTMPVHFVRFVRDGNHSPGLFLVSQDDAVRHVIEALILIWSASLAEHVFKS